MHWWHVVFLPAAAYQVISLVAILRYAAKRVPKNNYQPGISVLKPVLGLDPNTYEAFRSQADQDYPNFEIVFAVRNLGDPVVAAIEQLQREFPRVAIRLIHSVTEAPNGKVGALMDLGRAARHPVWVVSDGDIAVGRTYLRDLAASLADEGVGVVTCPYRAWAHSLATNWEALGIATDFIPSTMVAQLVGVRDFGLGSTLAFRAQDLEAAGGFAALAGYVADDFQLAHRITRSGKRAELSRHVVETSLGEGTWRGVWFHQLRWARTIRRSKGPGYAGLPITHAGLWGLIAAIGGAWTACFCLLGLRITTACIASVVLRAWQSIALFWMAPAWDLFAFAIWAGAWSGNTVHWRGKLLRLAPDGRIMD